MRNGAIFSGILHGVVILLLLMGLPELFRRELEPPPVIPIDIINISDMTLAQALKVKPKDNTLEEDPKEKPKPPKPMPVADKDPEPKPEEKIEPEPETAPEPEKTLEDLIPDEKPKKEEKPKEKQKEKPKKKKKKSKSAFDSLMKNLDKTKSSSKGKTQPEQDESSTADTAANTVGEVSVTEIDLVRQQISKCWNVNAGGKDARDLQVDVRIIMKPDATVESAKVVRRSKPASDPHMRAFENTTLRAIRNPQCSPLKLPLDRYEQWKTMTIVFTPTNMS